MDFLKDKSKRTFLKISETYTVPAYVADAPLITKEAADALSPELFADSVAREFPINNKAATWMSYAYFKEAAADIPESRACRILRTLKTAASAYNIQEDIAKMQAHTEKTAAYVKEATCAFVDKVSGIQHYPIKTAADAKLAIDYFGRNRTKLAFDKRKITASFIRKKANELNVPVTECVNKEAGYAIPNRDLLVTQLERRAALTKSAAAKDILSEVSKLANSMDFDNDSLNELEGMLAAADEANNMTDMYDIKIATPAESIYSMSVKQASDIADDTIVIDQRAFSLSKIASLSDDLHKEVLDDFLYNEVVTAGAFDTEKFAAIVPTLPLPDKIMLEECLVNVAT